MFQAVSRAFRVGPLLAVTCLLLAAPISHAQNLKVGGTGSSLGTVKLLGDAFSQRTPTKPTLTVAPNLGSSGGLKAVAAGAIDIAFVSRPLKDVEKAAGLVAWEYGRSPFVLVTNKAGIKVLKPEMVANFLSGRVGQWPDGQAVRVVLRPRNDGDNEYLAALSPEIAKALEIAHTRPGMVVATTDQDAADELEKLPGSLGVSTMALLSSEHRKLNVVAISATVPSVKSIADGSYPHFKTFYAVTRGAPTGMAAQFLEFMKSGQGRAILEANSHLIRH